MIVKLPTHGERTYHGPHPEVLRSVSAGRGIVHVELNNGDRYCATYGEVGLSGRAPAVGMDFQFVFGRSPEFVTQMSLVDYVGVLTAITIVRRLRK